MGKMSGEIIRPLSRIGLGGLTLAGGLADVTPLHAQVAQASVQEGQVSWNGMDIIPSRVLAVNEFAANEFAAKVSSPDDQFLADFKYPNSNLIPDESVAPIRLGNRSLLLDSARILPIVSAKPLDGEKYTSPYWNSEQHVQITMADGSTAPWLFVWRKKDGLNAATRGDITILRGPDGRYYQRPNGVRLTIEDDPINQDNPIVILTPDQIANNPNIEFAGFDSASISVHREYFKQSILRAPQGYTLNDFDEEFLRSLGIFRDYMPAILPLLSTPSVAASKIKRVEVLPTDSSLLGEWDSHGVVKLNPNLTSRGGPLGKNRAFGISTWFKEWFSNDTKDACDKLQIVASAYLAEKLGLYAEYLLYNRNMEDVINQSDRESFGKYYRSVAIALK